MTDPQTQPDPVNSVASGANWLNSLLHPQTRSWRYGAACGIVMVAFLLRLSLFGGLDNRLPFGFFLLAVMIVAWHGGLGPGLFAAALGLLLASAFFLQRPGPTGWMGEAERTSITVYVINSTLVSFLMDNLHARIKRLKGKLSKTNAPAGPSHG